MNLDALLPQANEIAGIIDDLMIDEMGLMAPSTYELKARDKRVYLVGHYDPLLMGRSLRAYENPEIARRLHHATGMPVHINRQTGTRFVVLMHGEISLPKMARFPGGPYAPDVFKLGVGVKGEIALHASQLLNVIIVAEQGSGKSMLLELLTHQMMIHGWKLYLADPQQHTFSPGIWNGRAVMPVAGSQDDMLKVLNAIENELATRAYLFQQASAGGRPPRDVDDYNSLGIEPLPRIGFVSDETNYYLESKSIFQRYGNILREGRKFGLHIIAAGHDWYKETIKGGVNDLFQTRIALNSLSAHVVLRNTHWGKWVQGRPPGRGVLRTNKFEPVQFYLLDEQQSASVAEPAQICPVPPEELEYVQHAVSDAQGKMTVDLLVLWGMGQRQARELTSRYEVNGWLKKDPERDNARFVTDKLLRITGISRANAQTGQSAQTALNDVQTGVQTAYRPVQTQLFAGGAS